MAYACRFCIAKRGLAGSEIAKLPQTWEGAAIHVEREHRYAVRRANETQGEAEERVIERYGKSLRRAKDILADRDPKQAAITCEIIERMGPIIQADAFPTAEDALNFIRKMP